MAKGSKNTTDGISGTPAQSTAPPPPVDVDVKVPPPNVPSARMAGAARLGLFESIAVVDRAKFDEMLVSLLHGYSDRFTAHSLPSFVMQMFGLKTRQDAVDLLQKMQKDNIGRKASATAS